MDSKKQKGRRKTNEQFIKEVYDATKGEYIFLEPYVVSGKKILCKHVLCGHCYEVSPSNFLRGRRCPRCSKRKSNDVFVEEIHKLVGDEYIFLEKYVTSETKILCKHTLCGHVYSVKPNRFIQGNRCPKCARDALTKSNKEFVKEVYNLVGEEYVFLEEYINAQTKILCKHVVCGGEYKTFPFHFLRGQECPLCTVHKKRKTNEEFVEEVYDLVGDEYVFLEEYVGTETHILCRHNSCKQSWSVIPSNFLRGSRCPFCAYSAVKSNEEFIKEVHGLVGDEYLFLEEYKGANTPILCKHMNNCGYIWKVRPSGLLHNGSRCPVCTSSRGEREVSKILKCKGVLFETEYSFPDLTGFGDGLLRLDFAIFDNEDNLSSLIEYDGEFHFERIYEDDGFEQIQIHDKRKNQYCKDNNIPLLRIPYWDFDNIEEILEEFLQLS